MALKIQIQNNNTMYVNSVSWKVQCWVKPHKNNYAYDYSELIRFIIFMKGSITWTYNMAWTIPLILSPWQVVLDVGWTV